MPSAYCDLLTEPSNSVMTRCGLETQSLLVPAMNHSQCWLRSLPALNRLHWEQRSCRRCSTKLVHNTHAANDPTARSSHTYRDRPAEIVRCTDSWTGIYSA